MKTIIVAAALLVSVPLPIASGAPCAPNTQSAENPKMEANMDEIAEVIFRVFLDEHATPREKVKIIYVGGDDGTRLKLDDFVRPAFVLKTGDGYEFRDGRYRDKETGRACTVVAVKIVSVEGDVATATIEWRQSRLGAGGKAYRLKKANGGWAIEKVIGSFAA